MAFRSYAFDRTAFAYEVFPEEVVILNLGQGSYFALGGWAVDLWPMLIGGQPVERIVAAIAARYDVPQATIRTELDGLVAKLLDEGILAETAPNETVVELAEPSELGFQPLSFEKHADMEDLLTLDPIHDVDPEQGWPKLRT